MEAASEGKTDVVEELIELGADVNVQDEVRCLKCYRVWKTGFLAMTPKM